MPDSLDARGTTQGKVSIRYTEQQPLTLTTPNATIVPTTELAHMLVSAFRYALGRATYITSDTAGWLQKYWHVLPTHFRQQIHRDIQAAIEGNRAGHDCDIAEWQKVLELPVD